MSGLPPDLDLPEFREDMERLGGVIHDLGNWLGVVVGQLELLGVRQDLSLPARHGVERALDASLQVSKHLQEVQQAVRTYRR
jgi:hypothetical protein